MKSLRLSIAVFLIISLIIQPNLITYGAQVRVEPDKSSVSANISNPETTEENASGPAVDITHIPQAPSKIEISAEPAEAQPEEPSEQTTVPVADPIKMMEENKTAVPGSENTPEPEAQLTSIPSAMPKEDEKNPVSEDKASSGSNTDNDEEKETKEETIKDKLGDIKSGLFGMLGISPDGAGDTTWQKDFTYVLDGEDIILSKYNGNASFLDIPAKAVIDGREYNSKFHSNCSYFFSGKKSLLEIDLSKVDSSNVTSMSGMFMGCASLIKVNFDGFDTGKVTNMANMFYECSSLESPDVGGFNTANVTNMAGMFGRCSSLTSLDLSNFDTGNVTSMRAMFEKCNGLTSLDISSFDTGNVGDMGYMFYNCSGLTSLDLSNFDTAKATIMRYMFYNCSGLTSLDVSGFDTADVRTMAYMFYGCNGLTGLDLSNFDTASVASMGYMFYDCRSLTELDLSGFNTARVTDMGYMFEGCRSLKSLDLSHFDTGNLQITRYMFYDCGSLTSLDLSTFDMSRITNADNMFDLTSELTQIEVPRYVQLKIALPATFVMKTNPSAAYTALPIDVTKSFTIIKRGSHIIVTGITLEPTEKTIKEGEEFTIKPIVKPDDASDKTVKWTTSSKKTATVDENGKVTGVSAGQATITATTNDGGKTATCVVTVEGPKTDVTGITVTPTAKTIDEGDDFTIIPTVQPGDADDKTVIWTSNASGVATVDGNGKVTGISEGEATITATTNDGGFTAECVVTVNKKKTSVTGVTAEPSERTIKEDEEFVITATVSPNNADDKTVKWASNAPGIATVDENGKVRGIAVGEATITVTTNDGGKKASCTVTVVKKKTDVTGITVSPTARTITEDEEFTITATVSPDNATDKGVTWSSSDTAVATVDGNGKVTGISAGEAVITVTTNDGGFTAECDVTVNNKKTGVTGVTVDPSERTIKADEEFVITATVEPENADDKRVIWTSSAPETATVDENGKVKGIAAGEATITATTVDGGYTAECVVTVTGSKIDVTGITVDPTVRTIEENEEFVIIATIIPDNATDKGVTFTSSDPLVAAVDEDGKVTGISEGEATITATTNDGNKKARCKVTVLKRKKDVTGITVEPASKTINTGEEFIISPTVTPDDATDKSVTWTSSDTDIAVVDRDGKVTGKAPGTVTITATTNDGGFTAGCTVTVIEEEEERVILNKYDISLYEGDRELIIATVKPDSVADKSVIWSSSDPAVATVDEHGWIEAVKVGVAVITATSKNGKTADCIVTVISRTVPVESITADPVSKTIFIGESFFITTTITPADATDKGVTWSSDDPVIASVYRGSVTGYSVGTTTVRVRTNDGGKEASCIVTVKERPVEVKSIILDPTEDQIFINETLPISAKVLPENAVDKTLKWTTNNPSVTTVDDNGNVRGVGLGEAVITARASNGVNAVCIIKVIDLPPRVKEIYVNPIVKTIYKGEAFTIVATVLPKDAGVTDVLWKSDKPDIATVDDKGRVFGKKAGEAIITAITVDGGFTAECKVTVVERPAPVPPVSYKLYIVDQRTKDAPSRHMVRGSVERLPADRYLILRDSDGSSIKPLINGDSSLDHNRAVYYDLSLRDAAGNKVNDFGKCTIRIPLIEDMDIHNGSVRVVSMVDDKLDRSISSSTGTEGDVSYVTFSTGHFTDFAILYKLNSSSDNHYNQNYYSSPYQYIPAINTGMAVNNSMRVLDRVPRTGEYIQFYGKGKEKFTKKWYSYKAL